MCDFFYLSIIYKHWYVKNKEHAYKSDKRYKIYVCKKFKYKTFTLFSTFQKFIMLS